MRRRGLRALCGVGLVCSLLACGRARTEAPRRERAAGVGVDETRTVAWGGRERRYLVHAPPRASGSALRALVLSLHGGGGHAEGVAAQTGFSAAADREGFVVAYPDGVDKGWNDGRAGVPSTAAKESVDDVGFLTAVLDDLTGGALGVDPSRVYVTGISNGAFMSSRFACERSERVAAIGLVAGTMGPELAATCRLARPVAVIAFLGTADPLVPYEGGVVHLGPFERGRTASARDAMRVFSTQNRCGELGAPTPVADRDPDDGSIARVEAAACAEDTSVQLYTLEGGGHTWPGGKQYLPARLVGRVNRDVDATATMWAFFREHGRRARK
ncbi:MAG TPA: PHB depolymerase family esterase [Polyangiaceae bacterium]|nr:PHB depolymerase family esterase [Polyangiaceae bacterium]